MGTAAGVSLDEYLRTSYDPDCEYVDGEVVERNLGERDHSKLQGALTSWFFVRRKELDIHPTRNNEFGLRPAATESRTSA